LEKPLCSRTTYNAMACLPPLKSRCALPAAAVCRYEVIDFLAVLLGYAMSGERTLEAFYERIEPWASAFMALFGRDRLPARATLSRFLASLDPRDAQRAANL